MLSQSTKLLMCKQETVFVPVVYQNNSFYLLLFLLDQFSVSYEIFQTTLLPLTFFFHIFQKKIKILKCWIEDLLVITRLITRNILVINLVYMNCPEITSFTLRFWSKQFSLATYRCLFVQETQHFESSWASYHTYQQSWWLQVAWRWLWFCKCTSTWTLKWLINMKTLKW